MIFALCLILAPLFVIAGTITYIVKAVLLLRDKPVGRLRFVPNILLCAGCLMVLVPVIFNLIMSYTGSAT